MGAFSTLCRRVVAWQASVPRPHPQSPLPLTLATPRSACHRCPTALRSAFLPGHSRISPSYVEGYELERAGTRNLRSGKDAFIELFLRLLGILVDPAFPDLFLFGLHTLSCHHPPSPALFCLKLR